MSKNIQPVPFVPKPATVQGPKVVRIIPTHKGEVDVTAVGDAIAKRHERQSKFQLENNG